MGGSACGTAGDAVFRLSSGPVVVLLRLLLSSWRMTLVCAQCAKEKSDWHEHCPHAMALWRDGYNTALRERSRPRLTSEDVREAISKLSASWENFYHLSADALNRILDKKEQKP